MTAVDHAELKRLAEGAKERAVLLRRLEALSEVADALEAMADGALSALSEIEGLKAERAEARPWQNRKDQWSEAISAAHPVNSDLPWCHECFETAMEMVGNRHGKYELVALVSWLLSDLKSLRTQAPDSWRPDRCDVEETIHAWLRDHAGNAIKMTMTPTIRDALAEAVLALRSQTAESGK